MVADDGVGFDPDRPTPSDPTHGYGLNGMQERAALVGARVTVASKPGAGTTVTVEVPL